MKRLAICLTGLVLLLSVHTAMADVFFTDLGGSNYGVTLEPLAFTVGSNEDFANRVLIENFFTTDQTTNGGIDISGEINWSLNGGPAVAISYESHNGSVTGTNDQIDPNDLLFNFTIAYGLLGLPALTAGDTVTVSTSNMVFSASGLRLPQTGPFTAHLLNFERSIATEADVALGVPGLVAIDIKPGIDMNCLNQKPVVIHGVHPVVTERDEEGLLILPIDNLAIKIEFLLGDCLDPEVPFDTITGNGSHALA